MKGLFVKDLCYSKQLVRTLVIFLLFASTFVMFQDFKFENLMYVFSYMIVCGAMISVNLIAYDQDQNGMSFLFTFPINRKEYVREKYLFSGFVLVVIFIIMAVFSIAAITMQHAVVEWPELIGSSCASIGVAIVMLSILIPLKLKFEEKGNIIMVVTIFIVVAFVLLAGRGLQNVANVAINLKKIVSFIHVNFAALAVGIAVLVVFILCVSMKISERVMERKEY